MLGQQPGALLADVALQLPARGGRLDEGGAPVVGIGAAVQQARVLELADDPRHHRRVDALDLGQLGDPHRAEPGGRGQHGSLGAGQGVPARLPVEHPRDAGERDAQPGDVLGVDLGHGHSPNSCLLASI